jgi:hypothetical protein
MRAKKDHIAPRQNIFFISSSCFSSHSTDPYRNPSQNSYLTRKGVFMFRLIRGYRSVFTGMTLLAFLISIQLDHALAALVDTQALILEQEPDQFRTRFMNLLAREDVRVALLQHGINPAEVEERITAMTDKELSQASESEGLLPAGAGGEIVVFPLAIVILILVGYVLVITGIFSLGAYAAVKVKEHQEEEYAKTTPFPAPSRVGSFPNVNRQQPWTGTWNVTEGQSSGVYVLKQTGNSVVSTPESDYIVNAKVYGAMIVGSRSDKTLRSTGFKAIIADDYLSFKGDINSQMFFVCERIESKSAIVPGPWSGKWTVQGAPSVSGIWALKQEGQKVISTGESQYAVWANLAGDKLQGEVLKGGRFEIKFKLALSEDGKTFEGYIEERMGTNTISGSKID